MIIDDKTIFYSPSDLVLFEKSPFASWMERLDRSGLNRLAKRDEQDEMMSMLSSMGMDHEAISIDSLVAEDQSVYKVDTNTSKAEQEMATVKAMKDGLAVIYQARLKTGSFAG